MPIPSLLVLRSIPAFRELPESEIKHLANHSRLVTHERKSVVIRQGEASCDVLFLLSGFVKIARGGELSRLQNSSDRRTSVRKEVALSIQGPGTMLGEIAALRQDKQPESIVALSICTLLRVEHAVLIDAAIRCPSLGLYTLRHLADRLVEAARQAELLCSSTEARIESLVRNLQEVGLPEELFPTNAEIGRMVGASRVMVSNVINRRTKEEATAAP